MPSPVKDAAGNTIEENLKDNVTDEKPAAEEKVIPVAQKKVPAKKPKTKKE